MRRLVTMLLATMLPGTGAQAAPWLVGDWFGTGQPYDKSEMWLAHMQPDGHFVAQFRACSKGKARDVIESGRWVLAGDTETITVTTVNGHLILPKVDLYKVLSHTGRAQTYRYLGNGFVYNSSRVAPGFRMPDCDLVS